MDGTVSYPGPQTRRALRSRQRIEVGDLPLKERPRSREAKIQGRPTNSTCKQPKTAANTSPQQTGNLFQHPSESYLSPAESYKRVVLACGLADAGQKRCVCVYVYIYIYMYTFLMLRLPICILNITIIIVMIIVAVVVIMNFIITVFVTVTAIYCYCY